MLFNAVLMQSVLFLHNRRYSHNGTRYKHKMGAKDFTEAELLEFPVLTSTLDGVELRLVKNGARYWLHTHGRVDVEMEMPSLNFKRRVWQTIYSYNGRNPYPKDLPLLFHKRADRTLALPKPPPKKKKSRNQKKSRSRDDR